MSFLNPWFAAAVAAVVIPALLILYFLKLRRREEPVPSTLLWKRAVQDLQVNAPFQRLRRNLLLLLQLLILGAAIFALARPIVQTTVADAERLVILIDHSASMNTREGSQTRLAQAKEQAIRLVRTLNQRTSGWRSFFSFTGAEAETQVMVIAFSDRATIIAPFSTNVTELADLIARIQPTDGRTEMSEALALAEAYMAPPTRLSAGMEDTPVSAEAPAKIVLISDGRIAQLENLVVRGGGEMELIRVGEATDNVGITALRTQRNYERPESVDVFLTVENFGTDPVETDISIHVDGTLRTVEPVALGPKPTSDAAPRTSDDEEQVGSRRSLSFTLLLDQAAILEARLARDDLLPVDNRAFAAVPSPRRQSVLIVTDGKYPFLDSVIRGLPLKEYPFATPARYDAQRSQFADEGRSLFDVVIFDKHVPSDLPAGNYLLLGVTPPAAGIEVTGTAKQHAVIWWDETHPVLRHVALDYVYVAESQTVKLPDEAQVLAEGPGGPILFRYAEAGRHYLCLTFPVESSTWWSKVSFAVFMYNAIRYLGGGETEAEREVLRPGDTLRVPIPPETERVELLNPAGRRVNLVPDASGVAYYGGTDQVGLYRLDAEVPGQGIFAVNLEDDWESDIRPPAGPLKTGTRQIQEAGQIKTATPEVWRWFIGAALLLVLLEWWIYNKRVMI